MTADNQNQLESKLPDPTASQVQFRPRARIIQTIGRDLISNHIIATQELVKNAYDADASDVRITFEPPLEIGKGAVIITDNGEGMTLEDIRRGWMEPATISKVTRTKSRTGRRVTGEKGIGRFAAARVGRYLEIITRSKDDNQETKVSFDWTTFEDPAKYLDEISCTLTTGEAAPEAPKGTQLKMSALNDNWDTDSSEHQGATYSQGIDHEP